MIELVAGALLAAAVLAVVAKPLIGPGDDAPLREGIEPDPAAITRADQFVARMARRLPAACAHCGHPLDTPAAFCPRCGARLLPSA